MSSQEHAGWDDAALAAALVALDPILLGGAVVKALPGPVRTAWLEQFRELLPVDAPFRMIPVHVTEDRLLGGMDLAATLGSGRPVFEGGLLSECDGGVAVLAMAERAQRATISHLAAALDSHELIVERDGFAERVEAAIDVIALDEGIDPEETVAPALHDRLAFNIDLRSVGIHDVGEVLHDRQSISLARDSLAAVTMEEEDLRRLCAAAISLGIESPRACILAVRAARAAAALSRRDRVCEEDLSLAARLVLAPRAVVMPAVSEEDDGLARDNRENASDDEGGESGSDDAGSGDDSANDGPLQDAILQAALAAIPANLLASLRGADAGRSRPRVSGKSGAFSRARSRGRPLGAVRGDPRSGARLSLVGTLRAAAPWQRLRRQAFADKGNQHTGIVVRRDDFRIKRFKQRSESTTIFVVDASGSAALHRLAEAKGAVELLLADCYVRRDQVALVSFRGAGAEVLLPPTRSLVRAKRCLSALPGGGGTPLAAGVQTALHLADAVRRRGGTPAVVMLTDGRANIARDGATGREHAFDDALVCASEYQAAGIRAMVVDTSPRPHENARRLADRMGGIYLPLPHADATALSQAVQSSGLGSFRASATGARPRRH